MIHNFFIPHSRKLRLKWIPRSKSGASISRPRWAAHTRIGNVWMYPPRGSSQRVIMLLKIKAMLNVSLRSKRFLASSSTKLGREQKKKRNYGGGGGE